ncbi:glycoside hydrolase family 38 N-terminal domain-containing protein [Pseudothermotoga sp.]|nr:alpha-mannosidase [Pseudothermotoga sp.]MCX7813529.1 alpha-mannosidase [Pseudothermotoga sp.]MDW8140550.1 alpha-mannosidase [Pseudothermotoga sp.]
MKIICHTHWDREWFAPSFVTNEWLRELFEKLFKLIETKKDYTYVLDGQTLLIEDLFNEAPELEEKVKKLVKSGNLLIGPFYAQIDFRLSPEIAIIKNFEIGRKDMSKLGGNAKVAWMVDNFGFISQLPQLLRKYGIEGAFLWRGVGIEKPSIEFVWNSKEHSQIKCIFLVGGYRNLYGLSFTKDLARRRLQHEIEKLKIFSLSGEVPLLDGYDLDTNPEDPRDLLDGVTLSTPGEFLNQAFSKVADLSTVNGELISGKYACTFPGTLSTRVYLKMQSYVIGKLLRYVELLSSLKGEEIEELHRTYLKTLIHDNICGVGVDLVNKNMQKTYARMYTKLKKMFIENIKALTAEFEDGRYVVSFSPFNYDHWHCDGKRCYKLSSKGVGIFRLKELDRSIEDETLSFKNDYYDASFCEDGSLKLNNMLTGILKIEKELGDSYSTYTEEVNFSSRLLNIRTERAGERHKVVLVERCLEAEGILIKTKEKVIFDGSPLVKWQIEAELNGKNYILSFVTRTGDKDSKIFAKMPFDVVERVRVDTNLLDRDAGKLNSVLLAAREIGSIKKFPFQGFVALFKEKTIAVMSKGTYQYEVDLSGDVKIDLVRSVEWIAKTDVKGRTGDAGPLMYIPDAKCEGTLTFELAVCELDQHVCSEEFFRWFTLFDDQPILISVRDGYGKKDSLKLFSGELPWVCVVDGKLVMYNPYSKITRGLKEGQISEIPLKTVQHGLHGEAKVRFIRFPAFPKYSSRNDPKQAVDLIEKNIEKIKEEISLLENDLKKEKRSSVKYHLLKHSLLGRRRTLLELKVCSSLCKGRIPKKMMKRLNRARAKRRIYDYIVELVKEGST